MESLPPLDAGELAERIRAARGLIDVKYSNVASFTILLLDYLYTLDMEITHIWSKKWNIVKCIFLIARYSTFIDVPLVLVYSFSHNPSLQLCSKLNATTSWMTAIGVAWTEAILVVRTHGLMGAHHRKFLIYLIVQITILFIVVIVVLAISVPKFRYSAPPLPNLPGCYITDATALLFVLFVILLLHEIIVMVITLVIGFKKYRAERTPLITTLYRDGTLFFVLIFFVSLANILNLVVGSEDRLDLFTTLQRVMHSVLSTRILLHVRQVADGDIQLGIPLSQIEFTSKPTSRGTGTTSGASGSLHVPGETASKKQNDEPQPEVNPVASQTTKTVSSP